MTFDLSSAIIGGVVGLIVGIGGVVFAAYRIWFRTDG